MNTTKQNHHIMISELFVMNYLSSSHGHFQHNGQAVASFQSRAKLKMRQNKSNKSIFVFIEKGQAFSQGRCDRTHCTASVTLLPKVPQSKNYPFTPLPLTSHSITFSLIPNERLQMIHVQFLLEANTR